LAMMGSGWWSVEAWGCRFFCRCGTVGKKETGFCAYTTCQRAWL